MSKMSMGTRTRTRTQRRERSPKADHPGRPLGRHCSNRYGVVQVLLPDLKAGAVVARLSSKCDHARARLPTRNGDAWRRFCCLGVNLGHEP